ncbi:hypothetical protein OIU78_012663 [Salix suchowensis]|nr:hypothetical protein OIU78_012663 [Salix suchowensis]
MAIAAARLGLDCATIGHVGDEIYAQFLLDVLYEEGMSMAGMHVCEDDDIVDSSFASDRKCDRCCAAMGCGGGRNVATLDKVTELMRASDITEDDEFWSELERDLDAEEITILSKMVINGRNIQANHIALQKVLSELLLPMLENMRSEGKVASRWMR